MHPAFIVGYLCITVLCFIPSIIYVITGMNDGIEYRTVIKVLSRPFLWPILLLIYFLMGIYFVFKDLFKSH